MHGRTHGRPVPVLRQHQQRQQQQTHSSLPPLSNGPPLQQSCSFDEDQKVSSIRVVTPRDANAATTTTAAAAAASPAAVRSSGGTYGHPRMSPSTLRSASTTVTQRETEAMVAAATTTSFSTMPLPSYCKIANNHNGGGGGASSYAMAHCSSSRRVPVPSATVASELDNTVSGTFANAAASSADGNGHHQAPLTSSLAHRGLTSPAETTTINAANHNTAGRAERAKELEEYVLQRCGRHCGLAERQRAAQKALSLVPVLYPALAGVTESLLRYEEDTAAAMRRASDDTAAALRQQEERLYTEFEAFFEGKIKELVIARQDAEARAEVEHATAFALRQERDTELAEVKAQLMQRMNDCEHTEDQFRDFRHFIASVFQTNQQLTLRIDQLESVLSRHRIDIPPASAELSAYKTSSDGRPADDSNGAHDGAGGLAGTGHSPRGSRDATASSTRIPVAFMAAANKELAMSRLTLQDQLLSSALDDRSAYRLRVEGLNRQNQDLTFHISELENKMKELYTYIHEKRFITRVDEDGNETAPLTPRPRAVPLTLQTELGIDLRHSTDSIMAELSTVSINMKHQLNSALLRSRQLHSFALWWNDADVTDCGDGVCGNTAGGGNGGVLAGMVRHVAEAAVIPVFPVAAWPSIPHFLRTNVAADVLNSFWTEAQAACILHSFFTSYKATRSRARFVRDSKMLAPRVHQLFERRQMLLSRLDACKEDAALSAENIPFGYVVSQFAREVLTQLSPQSAQDALPLVLPGTVMARYTTNPTPSSSPKTADSTKRELNGTGSPSKSDAAAALNVDDCKWVEAAPVLELEWTRFTYNMWYAALRYQQSQPLCQLFVDLVDGRVPLETFDVMERVLARVRRLVDQLDAEGSRQFTYARLVKGTVKWVAEAGTQAVLRGVRAVAHTFQANHGPLHASTLGPLAVFADETYCAREGAELVLASEAANRVTSGTFVPANATAAALTAVGAAVEKEKPKTPLPGSITVHALPLPMTGFAAGSPLLLPPLGATVFVRFWRTFVRDALEGVYARIEEALSPLVEESEVVRGLYLVSVSRALAVLAQLDNARRQAALRAAVLGDGGLSPEASMRTFSAVNQRLHADTLTGAKLVAEAADLLGVHGVAHSFLALLESHRSGGEDKQTAEHQLASETMMRAVGRLQRFKMSTHFPTSHGDRLVALLRGTTRAGSTSQELMTGASLADATSAAAVSPRAATAGKAKDAASGDQRTAKAAVKVKNRRTKSRVVTAADAKEDPVKAVTEGSPPSRSPVQPSPKQYFPKAASATKNSAATPAPASPTKGASGSSAVAAPEEGEFVEWYGLLHTLRQTVPEFPWMLFQPDNTEEQKDTAEDTEKEVREMNAEPSSGVGVAFLPLGAYKEGAPHESE